MAANDYHFITPWRVHSTPEEISEILGNGPDLARWWPSVYLEVEQLEPGGADGTGAGDRPVHQGLAAVHAALELRVTEIRQPHGFTLEAIGDFVGRGIWTFEQVGDETVVTYDWKIAAEKASCKSLSFIMKPIFAANHRWAMARGEESLRLELARRKATTLDATDAHPASARPDLPAQPPPPPSVGRRPRGTGRP